MTRRATNSSRRGFTLIELLVVISIIALLASLIAPAVQSSRRAARKVECLNNMRNVGLGILNFATTTGGELPALATSMAISNAHGSGVMSVGWPIKILPAIDNAALLKNIQSDAIVTNGVATMNASENIWLQVYTCPDDVDSYRQAGGLSYVVNAGFISSEVWGATESPTFFHQPYLINWSGSATPPFRSTDGTTGSLSPSDLQVALASGVFWRTLGDGTQPTYRSSIDFVSIGDGTTTTLMLTENLNAGPWYSTTVNAIGFGIRVPVDSTNYAPLVGSTGTCGEFTSAMSLDSQFPCSTFVASSSGSLINQPLATTSTTTSVATTTSTSTNLTSAASCESGGDGGSTTTTTSSAPRPSSQHPGGINAIMVDGSGRFLSENIDPFVYAKLVTSNGVSFSEKPLDQAAY